MSEFLERSVLTILLRKVSGFAVYARGWACDICWVILGILGTRLWVFSLEYIAVVAVWLFGSLWVFRFFDLAFNEKVVVLLSLEFPLTLEFLLLLRLSLLPGSVTLMSVIPILMLPGLWEASRLGA